ncbi:hypothetical protein RGQ29_009630 [Quercus rubra]|uniref:NAC domain-containing protein n=1 Tax=Quercus rubra TaxID=3512 RepID=A0AAN7J6D0_QUERU|nr:hypothetical protein RGQ29_009630 [Quercus rubra]
MSHPAAPLPSDLEFNCPDKEVIWTLHKFIHGCPLPCNVIKDIDPYDSHPDNLPDRTWFLSHSEVDTFNDHGSWKVKGAPSNVFSDSTATGLRTTLEFCDSQAPHERITNRVMQVYSILQRGHSEGSNVKASEDDDIVMLGLTERSLEHQHQNLHEIDHPPEGDFLELIDLLDDPESPSSSESSCMTMSSDECFDSLALLQELKPENNQNGAGCKFNVSAPVKPNEVVVFPATTGSRDREKMLTPSEIPKTDSSTPESTVHCQGSKIPKQNSEAPSRNEGSSSNSHNLTPPFSSHIVAADQENTAAVVRKKKFRKYLCFMPF